MSIGRPFIMLNLSKIILIGTINGSVTIKTNSSIALSSEIGSQDSTTLTSIKNNVNERNTSIMLVNKYINVNFKLNTWNGPNVP